MPERTFEWNRFVYLVVHGRELTFDGTQSFSQEEHNQQKHNNNEHIYPNILHDIYLDEIAKLEADLPQNVAIPYEKKWEKTILRNSTNYKLPIKFSVIFLKILLRTI